MRRAVLAVLLVSAAASACSSTPKPTHALRGSVTLLISSSSAGADEATTGTDGTCSGAGGYSDLDQGAQIVVKVKGEVVATGSLGAGHGTTTGFTCTWPMTFDNPLPDAAFYSVQVSHRGELTYSRSKLATQGWKIDLSIGGGS